MNKCVCVASDVAICAPRSTRLQNGERGGERATTAAVLHNAWPRVLGNVRCAASERQKSNRILCLRKTSNDIVSMMLRLATLKIHLPNAAATAMATAMATTKHTQRACERRKMKRGYSSLHVGRCCSSAIYSMRCFSSSGSCYRAVSLAAHFNFVSAGGVRGSVPLCGGRHSRQRTIFHSNKRRTKTERIPIRSR